MNRTVFSLPDRSEFRTASGLAITRMSEQFTGDAKRLDDLIDLLDRRRGVVLSSGTTVPGRYESFDLGFADPPLVLETSGTKFSLSALNPRGEVLIAFIADVLREPCVVIDEKSATRLTGHIVRGDAPMEEDQRTRRASVIGFGTRCTAAIAPERRVMPSIIAASSSLWPSWVKTDPFPALKSGESSMTTIASVTASILLPPAFNTA